MKCENCNNEHDGTYGSGRFCSSKCARGFSTKNKRNEINEKVSAKLSKDGKPKIQETKNCKFCGNKNNHRNALFCSPQCRSDFWYKTYIERWQNDLEDGLRSQKNRISNYIRRYLWEKYNNKCCKCGWDKPNLITKKPILEIHHIDGNDQNNKEENLELLCPNCHSLTDNYRALNYGKGNKDKHNYYGLR